MPFYEYECSNCKFYTEVLQKVSDAPLRKCPSCGRNALKKLVSAPVFRLKGSGWYETDFKSDNEHKRNLAIDKEPEKESASADSGDSKSGESKASGSKAAEPAKTEAPRRRVSRASATTAARARKPAASRRPSAPVRKKAKPARSARKRR